MGCWVVTFNYIQILKVYFESKTRANSDQTPRSAASDLILHCLSMSHKKNARLGTCDNM